MIQRLQKFLSAAGICSRRQAERLIEEGRVAVNGARASIGMSCDPDADTITLDGENVTAEKRRHYIMLNKPKGYVTTLSDEKGRPTVAELVNTEGIRLYPVGRLDMDSEGLMLMTDDGEFANRMMHPRHSINKVYQVFVRGENVRASVAQLNKMTALDGEAISKPQVTLIERRGAEAELQFIIHEGKNRQVRRMCDHCALKVTRLIRIAEGSLVLGDLPSGAWRNLTKEEINSCK